MLHLIPLFALLAASSALYIPEMNVLDFNSTIDERIIGGIVVAKNSYPFMVRVEGKYSDGTVYICGASLLHEDWVVTAAHCIYNGGAAVVAIRLHFGDHNQWKHDDTESAMDIPMSNIEYHSQYHEANVLNDIAIIRLPHRAPISAHVQPICVSSAATASGHGWGTALGWGLTSNGGKPSEFLQEIHLPVLIDEDCPFKAFDSQIMICLGNTRGYQAAACTGDSGGPFFIKAGQWALTGISSFVSGRGCVAIGFGVVYARVSNYIPWLQARMGSSLCIV